MSFDLFAFVEVLDFSVDDDNRPVRIYSPSKCEQVLIGNFDTREKAEKAIKKIKHVSFARDGRDWVASEREIRLFEIVQTP